MITLSLFVENRMKELGLTRRQLAEKLGYVNIYKGFALLDKIAKGQMVAKEQVERLASVLATDVKDFIEPLQETCRLLEERIRVEEEKEKEKERSAFEPFLVAVGEKESPEPVFVACLMHNRRFIHLTRSFTDLSPIEQLERISNLINEHMDTHKGGLPGFGYFTHYVYRRSYDEDFADMLYFGTDGELISHPPATMRGFKNAIASLRVGGKKANLYWLGNSYYT
jgi:transcriptional regulator with XRE-family HTH domain